MVALGGELLPDRHAFAGPTTEIALAQLRVGTFFLSPAGLDARGMYAQSPAEASVQRQLVDIADNVVLVCTSEVFATSAPALIAPLDRLTMLVADERPPAELAGALRRSGVLAHVLDGCDERPGISARRGRDE